MTWDTNSWTGACRQMNNRPSSTTTASRIGSFDNKRNTRALLYQVAPDDADKTILSLALGASTCDAAHQPDRGRQDAESSRGRTTQALAFGPGHVGQTPDAGEHGAAVYSAHRDTHFRFLKDVEIGDEIAATRQDGKKFRYRVTRTSVVRFDASGIDPPTDAYELALSTCWPAPLQ